MSATSKPPPDRPIFVLDENFPQPIIEELMRELEVTSPWQINLQRVAELLRATAPVSDVEEILDRLLFLDDVASTVVGVLEEVNGEGLAGYSSVDGQHQGALVGDARKAFEEAWAIVGGDDDEADDPKWPGEDGAYRAIRLIGGSLMAMLASLEGAPEALEAGAGAVGARLSARLLAARDAAAGVITGDELSTVQSLADDVTTLTAGFSDLVEALDESAAIVVDAGWAEASGGDEEAADA